MKESFAHAHQKVTKFTDVKIVYRLLRGLPWRNVGLLRGEGFGFIYRVFCGDGI